jgi:hypothetical protein
VVWAGCGWWTLCCPYGDLVGQHTTDLETNLKTNLSCKFRKCPKTECFCAHPGARFAAVAVSGHQNLLGTLLTRLETLLSQNEPATTPALLSAALAIPSRMRSEWKGRIPDESRLKISAMFAEMIEKHVVAGVLSCGEVSTAIESTYLNTFKIGHPSLTLQSWAITLGMNTP